MLSSFQAGLEYFQSIGCFPGPNYSILSSFQAGLESVHPIGCLRGTKQSILSSFQAGLEYFQPIRWIRDPNIQVCSSFQAGLESIQPIGYHRYSINLFFISYHRTHRRPWIWRLPHMRLPTTKHHSKLRPNSTDASAHTIISSLFFSGPISLANNVYDVIVLQGQATTRARLVLRLVSPREDWPP